MSQVRMNSMERALSALSFKETDRVPLFLLLSFYGAKELGVSIKEYFKHPEWILEAQKRFRKKFSNDCFYGFLYAAAEIEAWGGEVVFAEDGPPNSGAPFLRSPEMIFSLEPPRIDESPSLLRTLETIKLLKTESRDEIPVFGVVLSPFSAPVMQMGFEAYLNLLLDGYRAGIFEKLMAVNGDFCVRWGNAQLEAGATAIVYFDPLASTDMVPLDLYEKTGFEIAKRVMSRICGPTATHLASSRTGKAFDLIARTGTAAIGFSGQDDLNELKKMSTGRLALLGNLNGVAMRGWDSHKAESEVKRVLDICAPGGGFILSDSHGEIPWSVPEEVLYSVSEVAISWKYPEPEGR